MSVFNPDILASQIESSIHPTDSAGVVSCSSFERISEARERMSRRKLPAPGPVHDTRSVLVAGLLSLAGALTYAELGAMMPHAGGEYLYVQAAYGNEAAFLNGWMRFVVGSAGISALGVGFATFLSAVVPMPAVWAQRTVHLLGREINWQIGEREAVAVVAILLFGALNCAGVGFGGRLQSVLTAAKVLGIAVIVFGAFLFSRSGSAAHFRTPASAPHWAGLQAFGAACFPLSGPATDGPTCR